MSVAQALAELNAEVVACRRCPELRAYCANVAQTKRRAYAEHPYHGAPVPGFGDPAARLLIVGLAPGAHGSNRTGRMFTGDGSGEWLYRTLHRFGFASQPVAIDRDDGMRLHDAYITAAVRCAPPDNKPTPVERDRCVPFLAREFALLETATVVVTLGKFADDAVHALLRTHVSYPAGRSPFGHGAESKVLLPNGRSLTILASYHPSRQNTNTGKLTQPMLDAIFARAAAIVKNPAPSGD